jgi:hypothetical protein
MGTSLVSLRGVERGYAGVENCCVPRGEQGAPRIVPFDERPCPAQSANMSMGTYFLQRSKTHLSVMLTCTWNIVFVANEVKFFSKCHKGLGVKGLGVKRGESLWLLNEGDGERCLLA